MGAAATWQGGSPAGVCAQPETWLQPASGAAERGGGSLRMDPAECPASGERRAGLASHPPLQLEVAQVIASQQGVAIERLTIEQFVFSVAQLGGFLRRASDGPPGWQTLWQGWLRLRWVVAGMRFAAPARLDNYARSPCTSG